MGFGGGCLGCEVTESDCVIIDDLLLFCIVEMTLVLALPERVLPVGLGSVLGRELTGRVLGG